MTSTRLNHKSIALLTVVALAYFLVLPVITPFQTVAAQSQDETVYSREFSWEYAGHHWIWNLSIPTSLYAAYKTVPDSMRVRIGPEEFGYFTTTQDSYIQTLAQKLNETAAQEGYGSYDEVNFALSFVQSIPYKTDNESTGYESYPRFPVETLVDNVGDCKSHSVLFASLMLAMDYGTVYINPPNHLAVGILGNNLKGTYWTYNNETYYYCETTGAGFKIGDLPQEFDGQTAKIFPIDENIQYVPNFDRITYYNQNPTITLTTPTLRPSNEPNAISSPSIAPPTAQTALPISWNLISESPVMFAIVIIAVACCIIFAVRSVRMPKQEHLTSVAPIEPAAETDSSNAETMKYCIFCGASNRGYAEFCEKCGKKIV